MAKGGLRRKKEVGKKAVYMTPHRGLALEVVKMYERKGLMVELVPERDTTGRKMFVVYIFV